MRYVGPDVKTRANPLTYVSATAPPFLFMLGSQDRLVSPSQTLLVHNALLAAGSTVRDMYRGRRSWRLGLRGK